MRTQHLFVKLSLAAVMSMAIVGCGNSGSGGAGTGGATIGTGGATIGTGGSGGGAGTGSGLGGRDSGGTSGGGGTVALGGSEARGGTSGSGGTQVGTGGAATGAGGSSAVGAGGTVSSGGTQGVAGGSSGSGGATGGSTGTATCSPADKTAAPTPVSVQTEGTPFTGSHQVVVETDPGLSESTIYRPKDLGAGAKYPIVAWGEGGCSLNGTTDPEFLGEIASHGYLVIADGTPNGSTSRPVGSDYKALGQPLLKALDWAIKENERACSQYYQGLDTSKIAVFGWSCGGLMAEGVSSDPRLTTVMLNSSGMVNQDQSIYPGIHTPVLIVLGGTSDAATPNGMRDYNAINNVPMAVASTEVGHGGTYTQDNGGSFAKVDVAWLNWWLKGDTAATGKGMFVGTSCGLCSDSSWTLQSKNLQ